MTGSRGGSRVVPLQVREPEPAGTGSARREPEWGGSRGCVSVKHTPGTTSDTRAPDTRSVDYGGNE
jgi:hypothetical protein